MNKLSINRLKEYNNRGKEIKLYVNNKFYDKIGLDEEIIYTTNKDSVKIKAKIDWCTSQNYEINFKEKPSQTIQIYSSISNFLFWIILVGVSTNFILTIIFYWKINIILLLIFAFIPLYKISIGYNNYLRFKSI